MTRRLRALIVEDFEPDAVLLVRELTRGGFDVHSERVETREAMVAALTRPGWDIIFSDYALPTFSAPDALAVMKELQLDLPFIIVSGTVGEDVAVASLHAGAHDFLTKGRLARLLPAVERELREASLRSSQRKLSEQLQIAERMASMGSVAAGIAHEINNPLTAIVANLTFALEDLARLEADVDRAVALPGEDTPVPIAAAGLAPVVHRGLSSVGTSIREARDATGRVRDIVRDLKLFSHNDEDRTGPVDVRRVIESSIRLAWAEIRHRARLVKDYAPVPPVEANEGRLGQVFLNLLSNAAQAIPDGRAESNEVRVTTGVDARGKVFVDVSDTGTGIPAEILPRIFEPFFTTKPRGLGTGLGLSICERLVSAVGGSIVVQSQPGRGTSFRVTLEPARPAVEAAPAAPVAAQPATQRGRVLVIDDEAIMLTIAKRMLVQEHDVTTERSAAEALARIEAGERFDVILCDMMMPQMSGMDLHAALLERAPDQADRIVFMTGGVFSAAARDFLERVRNPRLDKPFDVGGLRAMVHRMLR